MKVKLITPERGGLLRISSIADGAQGDDTPNIGAVFSAALPTALFSVMMEQKRCNAWCEQLDGED